MDNLQQKLFALKDRKLRRVHIIGGPGSGKTTLAQKIGRCLESPVYELDKIAFEGPEFTERPLSLRLNEIGEIATQPAWITEGMWLGWTDELLRRCDMIIWLDHLSWLSAAHRILTRFARNGLKQVIHQSGLRKFTRVRDYARNLRQLVGVLHSSRAYYHNSTENSLSSSLHSYTYSQAMTASHLVPYHEKLLHCRSKDDVATLLTHLDLMEAATSRPVVPSVNQGILVSIIINNYNYGRYLKYAIDSALCQSYKAVEVIVVDDGSTDNSHELISGYGNKIIPIFKENGGQASALNVGFAQSHGDIVIFLDSDDMLLPDTVQKVVEAFQAHPNVAKVMYRMNIIDAEGRITGELKPEPHLPLRSGDLRRYILTFPFDMTWMATSGNAFAADALRKIMPIPEQDFPIMADFYLSHLVPLLGMAVFLSHIGAHYRIHHTNHYARMTKRVDLSQIRKDIVYGQKTCVYIQTVADKLKLESRPPIAVKSLSSVSLLSKRLTSLKLDPDGHPMEEDTVWCLFQSGVRASWRRFDVSWAMKILYIIWFTAMLPAPKPVAYWLASVFSFPDRRRSLNKFLGALHHVVKE